MGNKTAKRLAILIGVLALIGGGGYFLRTFQVGRMAQGVVARAERAEGEGKYGEASRLYAEHLAVVPDDIEVQIKYAEALLKQQAGGRVQEEPLAIFERILEQYPGRDDVRRRAAEVASAIGAGVSAKARGHLAILLKAKANEEDGHLHYLMATCQEREGEFADAEKSYAKAIEHGAPERLEAAQMRAILLREKLNRKDEADRVIDAMVKSAPDDYRTYLGRGRYRDRSGEKGAGDDFRKAIELAPDRPEAYLDLARVVEREAPRREAGMEAARQVLDKAQAAAARSAEIYQALSALEQRAGRVEEAVKVLELGVKTLPDDPKLRGQLAILLASRGEAEAGRLMLQIAELERMGVNRPFTQYLTAYYHFNKRDFLRAKQILTSLQPDVARIPTLKLETNLLLGRCHAELGEFEQQQEATARALVAAPENASGRLTLIRGLIDRGDLDGAIREYQQLYRQQPGASRLPMAELMIERNLRLPAASRRWKEVEDLIAEAAGAAPAEVEPAILRARLLMAQGREADADDAMETIRARFPKDPRPWIARADLLIRRKDYDGAKALLDRARQQLGDRVDLRLAGIRVAAARGGPQVAAALDEVGRGLESLPKGDRIRLLTALAAERERQKDAKGAVDAWARLAGDEPQNPQPRLHLLELALQAGDGKRAEEQIRKIEELDSQLGYLCRSQYLAWQARTAPDPAARRKARDEARGLLAELKTLRPDWSRVSLAQARLEEEELADAGGDEAAGRDKLDSAIASYRRAIELGLRDPAVVRNYIQLLFRAGRGGEALDFYSSQMSALGPNVGDLGRVASRVALANREYQQAEEIARKAVESNPNDFQARVWLSQVLIEGRQPEKAEEVIRRAVNADKSDPDRWITLVRLLELTRRPAEAEQAVRDAESHLAAKPLALAQCSGIAGKALELSDPDRARVWYARAREWFAKAQREVKDPRDLAVKRQLAEFLLQTRESAEAEAPLRDIVAATADGKSPTLAAWARRSLAQIYAAADPPRIAEALALFPAASGRPADPADLRVLALIHEVQGTPEGRKQAIADLESVIGLEAATTEDRRRLAQVLEVDGQWPRAREQFRELIARADAARDAETIARRPLYFSLFVEALIRHHKPGDDSDLAEARPLIERLGAMPGNSMAAVLLEAQVDRAANQAEAGTRRILDFAARSDVNTATRLQLANRAERLGFLAAAEAVFRRVADEPPPDARALPNKVGLALFLAHRGRSREAVNLCEAMWAEPRLREAMANVCVAVLCGDPKVPADAAQVNRVVAWFRRAAAESPRSMVYLVGLGTFFERLGDYPRAEEAYRKAIQLNDRDGIASNNLAWLMALRGEKGGEALDLINKAIGARGPLPEYLDTRGMIYLITGERRRAIADLEASFRAAPSPPKYFHLAQAYLELNEKEKARKALQAGKSRGLPGGLHPLEMPAYEKLTGELGMR